ncbi:acyl carrier protein [Streptomyces avermitilis]|uniref:acyl carrier protein n=1 Tax=Streptomyces avermitilis TaxID=33903 RepID=UPI00380CA284
MSASSTETIESTIKEILVADVYLDVTADQISTDDSLRDEIGLDSLGFMELRVQCGRRFSVTIPDGEFNPVNFASVGTVVELIRRLQEAAGKES